MITQKELNKLLENPATYQQYLIIGQSLKPVEKLAADVANKIFIDTELMEEYTAHPEYYFTTYLSLFGKDYGFDMEPMGEGPAVSYYEVSGFLIDGTEFSPMWTIRRQVKPITERMFRNEIKKFIIEKCKKC